MGNNPSIAGIIRRDFHIIPSRKGWFAVRGRMSEWDGSEWHWLDGWYVTSYSSRERAQQYADHLNKMSGITTEKSDG